MTSAVVLRGYAYRNRTDWRPCVASLKQHVVLPLRQRYGTCDVLLATYDLGDTERDRARLTTALLRDYDPDLYVFVREGKTQRDMAVLALDVAIRANAVRNYDLVAVTRFDLRFKSCPLAYGTFKPGAVNFLWREWHARAWADHRRVPDAVHLMPGNLLGAFKAGVVTADGNGRCLHTVWHKIAAVTDPANLHVMNDVDEYVDSNTDVMPNPVYEIVRT